MFDIPEGATHRCEFNTYYYKMENDKVYYWWVNRWVYTISWQGKEHELIPLKGRRYLKTN